MQSNRPRAKSHSSSSSSSGSALSSSGSLTAFLSIPDQVNEEPNSLSPHIIKVSHPSRSTPGKSKRNNSQDSADDTEGLEVADHPDKEVEESSLGSSPTKFKLFSPRKKS